MKLEQDIKLDFQDVLLVPKHSSIYSRKNVYLKRKFKFKHSPEIWEGIPVISANMTSVTTRDVAYIMEKHEMLACIPKHKNHIMLGLDRKHNIPSYGLVEKVNDDNHLFLCLDVPNGYIEAFVQQVKWVRNKFPRSIIIAGNVVTPEMVQTLIFAGADIVKIGIGSGSACKTRLISGIGYPQLSAIIDCADTAHGLGGHIISDGGCVYPGDIVKAFAAGADFVMLGGMLAGHEENGQDFYGMSSERANNEFAGGLKDYKASEGWELNLHNRGPIEKTLQDILGGIRSGCSYVGAHTLKDLPKCATFIRVNNQVNTSLWDYRK